MTHPQDVPAPSPTVSEAMRDAVALVLGGALIDAGLGRAIGVVAFDRIAGILLAPAGPIASVLAALERERDHARTASAQNLAGLHIWRRQFEVAEAELATLRASAERMEAALVMARQAVANSVERHRPWAEEIAGRVNPWQPILDAVDAALTPKETPDA